jgi:microcystin degradation protein MlrC
MRVLLAQMKHETNTFSPVPTDLARFARGEATPLYGDDAYRAFKSTGTALAGFIDAAEEHGAEIVLPIAANAWPSGPVQQSAFEHMCDRICREVAKGCDAILLDLHGAMVTEQYDDGEGMLLERISAIAPEVPVGVALDMHANLSGSIVENATVITGYQTYPHTDFFETGVRAARPIFALLRGEAAPTMAWGQAPMLPHVMRQGTGHQPNQGLQERCREMERNGALAATLFTGFPHADVRDAGLSCVVVTDADPARAEAYRDELLALAWAGREAFVYQIEPLAQSLARASRMTEGPVVLLDHYDNAASGGTMDCMTVLRGIIEAGLENVVAFAIHDPQAVRTMIAAGVGNEVTLPLGGKIDMPAIGLRGEPLQVTGRVRLIFDGTFRNRGPAYQGVMMHMGPTAVLDTGRVEIVVISRHQEPNDVACLTSVGIDPASKRYLMLKSRVHWRAGFGPMAKDVVECAGTGVCTSDYSMLTFRKVRRPIFPLDRIDDQDVVTNAM